MKKIVGAIAALVVLLGLLMTFAPDGDDGSVERGEGAPSSERAPEVAVRAPEARARAAVMEERVELAPSSPSASASTSASGPSMLDQMVAIHRIASQAELSAYLEKNAEIAAAKIDAFCDEAKKLPKAPLFPTSARRHDAASYLGPRVDWQSPRRNGSLHLPDELRARVVGDGSAWLDTITAADLARADFTWMRELAAFDHWTLPPRRRAPDEPFQDVIEIPNYLQFRLWARLRFARAFVSGDFLDASREVRHLASLLFSQGLVLAEQFAAILLEVERVSYDVAAARGLNVEGWAPYASDDLARFRKLDRVGFGFLRPGVAPEIAARALECTPTPCGAIMEGAWAHMTVGAFSSRDTMEDFWKLAEPHLGCNPELMRQIRTAPMMPAEQAKPMIDDVHPLEKAFPTP